MWRAAPAATTRRSHALLRGICRNPCSSACPCSCCKASWRDELHACGVRPPTTPSWPRSKPAPAAAAPDLGTRRAAVGHLDRRALGGWRTALVVDRLGRATGRRLRPGRRADATDADAWRAADLAAGIPWIGAATQDLFIPQTVNLELIQGVSFTRAAIPARKWWRAATTAARSSAAWPTAAHEAGAQEGALANVDVMTRRSRTNRRPRDRRGAPCRLGQRLVRDRAGRAARRPPGAADGPRIASRRCPIPFSPSKRAPDERLPNARLLSARLLSARLRPNPWKVISGSC